MRKLIRTLLLGLAGMLIGAALAFFWFRHPSADATIAIGAWRANLEAGSQSAGLFSRARIAANGLLALNRGETIYFVAAQDDAGNTLSGACQYDVVGPAPAARWWSITLYGEDLFLVANPANRFSFNQANVTLDADKTFHIVVADKQQSGDWLPAPPDGNFLLVLRLYNPDPALAAQPQGLKAPTVKSRGPCQAPQAPQEKP
jgi:hypothetical protein